MGIRQRTLSHQVADVVAQRRVQQPDGLVAHAVMLCLHLNEGNKTSSGGVMAVRNQGGRLCIMSIVSIMIAPPCAISAGQGPASTAQPNLRLNACSTRPSCEPDRHCETLVASPA